MRVSFPYLFGLDLVKGQCYTVIIKLQWYQGRMVLPGPASAVSSPGSTQGAVTVHLWASCDWQCICSCSWCTKDDDCQCLYELSICSTFKTQWVIFNVLLWNWIVDERWYFSKDLKTFREMLRRNPNTKNASKWHMLCFQSSFSIK